MMHPLRGLLLLIEIFYLLLKTAFVLLREVWTMVILSALVLRRHMLKLRHSLSFIPSLLDFLATVRHDVYQVLFSTTTEIYVS